MIRVLIADDDRTVRERLGHFFEERGLTLLQAATLEEAVETARAEQPAVAILDSDTHSEIYGFAAVKAIQEAVPTVNVILLVAASHNRRHLEARRAGADVVLIKDLTTETDLGVAVINFVGKA